MEMDCLKELISCKICQNRLKVPVILPCGQTVCNNHVDVTTEEFKCALCSETHTTRTIIINKSISKALNENIDRKIFGHKYDNACNKVNKLEQSILDFNLVANHKEDFVHNYFSLLKNKIDLNVEQFRLRFDEGIARVRSNIAKYEQECNLGIKEGEMVNIYDAENEFECEKTFLNSLTLDENKWEEIGKVSNEKRIEVRLKLCELEKKILHDKQDEFAFENLDFRAMTIHIAETFDPFALEVADRNITAKLKKGLFSGTFCFQSLWNNRYLCAEDFGKKPILANRDKQLDWEIFSFVEQENSLVAIRALINKKYLSFQENKTVIASQDAIIDAKQKFEICFSVFNDRIVGIKSAANKRYLWVPNNQSDPIVATGETLWKNSMFRIKKV